MFDENEKEKLFVIIYAAMVGSFIFGLLFFAIGFYLARH